MENNEGQGVVPTEEAAKTVDYEQEYKKAIAERDAARADAEKQKKLKDQYASESAAYKKKELEKMSDEEKKAKEYQEIVDANSKLEAQIKEYQTRDELLSNGFTKEECDTLMKGGLKIKDFAEIMTKRLEENTKSVKASMIKDTTPEAVLGSGIGSKPRQEKSDFQKYQESKVRASNKVEL